MASPKPGDRNYKGPVHESVRAAQRSVDQHIKNAAGIPGDIDNNVRRALGDIFGFGKPSQPKAKPKPKAKPATPKVKAGDWQTRGGPTKARRVGTPTKPTKPKSSNKKNASKRHASVAKAAARVSARNSSLSTSQARAKARKIVKGRK